MEVSKEKKEAIHRSRSEKESNGSSNHSDFDRVLDRMDQISDTIKDLNADFKEEFGRVDERLKSLEARSAELRDDFKELRKAGSLEGIRLNSKTTVMLFVFIVAAVAAGSHLPWETIFGWF